ncbi:MAG: acyl--CoA ligase [Rhodoferax sp.]|nr:acyl--CoA ligase [Rhodoferax sp.]
MLIHSAEERERYRALGWWGDVRMQDLLARNAERSPEREALVDPPNLEEITGTPPLRLSWRALADQVQRLATALLELGLRRDDVVVLQMANSHELLACYLACARLGVIISPVVPQYREHELAHILTQSQASAMLVTARIGSHDHARMAAQLANRHPQVRRVMAFGEAADLGGAIDLRAAMRQADDDARLRTHEIEHPVGADDVLTLLWTSGSEGQAKAVPRTHNDWLLYAPQIGSAYRVGDGARLLNGRPLTTHGAFVGSITPWLFHAGTLINHHPFNLPVFLGQMRTESIDFTALAPAILSSLLKEPALLDGVDFTRLRYIGSGSAPLTEAQVRGFHERFGVEVINFFGSTEGASLVSAPADMPDPALRALYFPRFGAAGFDWHHRSAAMVQTRLIDPESGEIIQDPGRTGELCYRGPMVMKGYYRAPELSARALDAQGYYHSGDLFQIAGDQQQYYRFMGRAKDIIIRGGFNISAQEIENLVASHPAVLEVAVVPYPDARLGERICACVVPRPGQTLTLASLLDHLRDEQKLAVIKLPERLVLLDSLPRNPNNKVMKSALRDRAMAQSDPAAPA